jgi:pyrrolidone-carboxylate peptidase
MIGNVTMTGFTVFGGLDVNPTERIVQHFQEKDDSRFKRLQVRY